MKAHSSTSYTPRYLAAALFLLTCGLYAQVGLFDFTNYDDHFFVTENLMVQQGLGLHTLRWAFTDFSQGSWQPLTWLSHLLDYQLFGLSPSGHHLTSLLIHALNSALLGSVLTLYTGAVWRSFLVAALFAIHPLHVESVAWIAERRDVLSGFWWLLCMWRYWLWQRHRQGRNAVLLGLCFLGGLMSKPIVVTLPLILLLLDWWPLQRLPRGCICQWWRCRQQLMPLLLEKMPLFVLALLSGVVTILAEEGQGNLGTMAAYPMSFRVGNAIVAYVRYLGKTCWPVSLYPFYPYSELVTWHVGAALAVLVLITVFLLRLRTHHPYLLLGWLWYLLTLLPVIGIIQQGEFALADRYTYLPLIGIFMVLVWGGGAFCEWLNCCKRQWMIGIALVLVVGLSGLTVRQASFWRDTPTLFGHTLRQDPENFKALLQLGAYHRDRGELQQARGYFERVIRQLPRNREAVANLGDVYDKMGRYDEAVHYFRQALAIDPAYGQVYVNLGVLLAKQGNLPLAVSNFEQALALQPGDAKLHINLGGVFYLQGQFAAAAELFSKALRLDPASADAYNGLGLVMMAQGNDSEAIRHFTEALRINPRFQRARENLQEATARRQGGR